MNSFKLIVLIILLFCHSICLADEVPKTKNSPKKSVQKQNFSPAGNMERFAQLRDRVERAKSKDGEYKSDTLWEKLSSDLETFLLSENALTAAHAEATYLLARIYHRRYFVYKKNSLIEKAAKLYSKLDRKHPNFYKTDDALYYLGKIQATIFKKDSQASHYFHQIIKRFPASNRLLEAKKILGIPDGRFAAWSANKKSANNFLGSEYSVIVIDPGHGGIQYGAVGIEKAKEKDVVLNISTKLKKILESKLKIRTLLTRSTDDDIPLKRRTEIANQNNAALFISIHANSSAKGLYQGVETYYLDNTNDKSSLSLAMRENTQVSAKDGNQDLQFILSDLIQAAKLKDSISLAHFVQNGLISNIKTKYGYVRNLGVKKAPFHVLVGAYMPCILVEVAFIDHPLEGKRLLTEEYQALVAQSIATGIEKYLESETKKVAK